MRQKQPEYQCVPNANSQYNLIPVQLVVDSHMWPLKAIDQFICIHLCLDPENVRGNAVQIRCQNRSPPDLDAFSRKETTVQDNTQDLSTRKHVTEKGQTEEPNKQDQVIQDVSNMAPKTENLEDPLKQTSSSGIGNIRATCWESTCFHLRQMHANIYILGGHPETLPNSILMTSQLLELEMTNRVLRFYALGQFVRDQKIQTVISKVV